MEEKRNGNISKTQSITFMKFGCAFEINFN